MQELPIGGEESQVVPDELGGPEIVEEHELLVTLEQTLRDLDEISARIESNGGVCKTDAIALVNVADDILPERVPVNSFTTSPSAVNLQTTLEAIDFKSKWIIGGAIAAAFAIIAKMIHWVWKSLKGDKDETIPKRESAAVAVAENVEEQFDYVLTVGMKEVDEANRKLIEKEVKSRKVKMENWFEDNRSDLLYHIIKDRKLEEAVRGFSNMFFDYAKIIDSMIDVYYKTLAKAEGSKDDGLQLGLELDFLSRPIKVDGGLAAKLKGFRDIPTRVKALTGKDAKDLVETTKILKDFVSTSRHEKKKPTLGYDDIKALIKKNDVKDEDSYLADPERAQDLLNSLEERCNDIAKKASESKVNVKQFEKAAAGIKSNVEALVRVHSIVIMVMETKIRFLERFGEISNTSLKQVIRMGKSSEDPAMKELAEKLEKDHKAGNAGLEREE